ncbi:MAG: DUF21 domain-containing protein [Planctomycetaceae bacterium]|nr:DUF21 domain-containing protein [Planctomycetaceae bacterium]
MPTRSRATPRRIQMFEFLIMMAMLLAGIRLSAFFSGCETGFYRLSLPRLGIDARAQDRQAMRLLWFSQNPSQFVATCLVGNNLANYLTTAAISWSVVLFLGHSSEVGEVVSTLLFAPLLFMAAEVLPKSVYYQVPYRRLRHDVGWFLWVYRLCLPLTWPLVKITQQLERWSSPGNEPAQTVLGRNRLVQLMQHGQQEGVLTDIQSRLANGLLQLAPQPAHTSVLPANRVFGTSDAASRQEMLQLAKSYGVNVVAVAHEGTHDWYGYVRVQELAAHSGNPVIHQLPQIPMKTSKLEALNQLRMQHAPFGVVVDGDQVLGLISRQALVEQLFRPLPVATLSE